MSKNSRLVASFSEYCREHPDQRFWQALVNWSGYKTIHGEKDVSHLEDLYYKETE